MEYANNDTIPEGMTHVIDNDTICKMFKKTYSKQEVRELIETIKKDTDLEDSYKKLISDMTALHDKVYAEKLTRAHMTLAAKNFGLLYVTLASNAVAAGRAAPLRDAWCCLSPSRDAPSSITH